MPANGLNAAASQGTNLLQNVSWGRPNMAIYNFPPGVDRLFVPFERMSADTEDPHHELQS